MEIAKLGEASDIVEYVSLIKDLYEGMNGYYKSPVGKYPKIRGYKNEVQQRIQGAGNKTV